MSNGRIGTSHKVHLSPADRGASVSREELRARLLEDLGLAGQR
jgi:sulfonate transport system ATP-binding protein